MTLSGDASCDGPESSLSGRRNGFENLRSTVSGVTQEESFPPMASSCSLLPVPKDKIGYINFHYLNLMSQLIYRAQ